MSPESLMEIPRRSCALCAVFLVASFELQQQTVRRGGAVIRPPTVPASVEAAEDVTMGEAVTLRVDRWKSERSAFLLPIHPIFSGALHLDLALSSRHRMLCPALRGDVGCTCSSSSGKTLAPSFPPHTHAASPTFE